jgi:hypothetical protein
MKKLALEDLQVESFHTSPEELPDRGTVKGYSGIDTFCETWNGAATCYPNFTCNGVCESGPGGQCTQTCGPYTCSESYDHTFCDCDTVNDYTCYTQC